VPLISQHPGFISYYLVDSGGGVVSAISVFLNEADAEESNKRAADWVRQNLASFIDTEYPRGHDQECVRKGFRGSGTPGWTSSRN
jgi:hypothetical protein